MATPWNGHINHNESSLTGNPACVCICSNHAGEKANSEGEKKEAPEDQRRKDEGEKKEASEDQRRKDEVEKEDTSKQKQLFKNIKIDISPEDSFTLLKKVFQVTT